MQTGKCGIATAQHSLITDADCLVTFSTSQPLSVRVHSSTERPKFLVDEATSELNRLGKDMRLQATLELLPWLAPHGIVCSTFLLSLSAVLMILQ